MYEPWLCKGLGNLTLCLALGEDESTKKAKVLALAFNKLKQATPSRPKKERKEMADDSDSSSDNEEGNI